MSRLSDAAYEWMRANSPTASVSSEELWRGVSARYPQLTEITPTRKTPRTTLMRDLRKDVKRRFVVGGRKVGLSEG